MKILWLSHFVPYPPKGGILQRGYHLLKQTAKYHDVHLLAFQQNDLMAPLFNNVEEGLNEAQQHLLGYCKSVSILDIPSDSSTLTKYTTALKSLVTKFPYNLNWLISDEYRDALINLLNQESFDFIHFDTISLAIYKQYCGDINSSLDHHNIESHMLLRRASNESNILKQFYYYQEGQRLKKYEKIFCPTFSFNFTCSEIDTIRLQNLSKKSVCHTIANGVDVDFFKPLANVDKKNRILFVGTLSWYPNIEAVNYIANDIWPVLKKRIPTIEIDIIGANPPKEILELSRNDSNFRVHGFVEDIIPYYHNAKCYVCPIKDGGGTKLKIVDALSIGMAIVADEIACEGIDVTDKDNVLFATSPEEYVNAIEQCFNNDEQRINLQNQSRQLAIDKYSYDNIGKELSNLFIKYSKDQKSCVE